MFRERRVGCRESKVGLGGSGVSFDYWFILSDEHHMMNM